MSSTSNEWQEMPRVRPRFGSERDRPRISQSGLIPQGALEVAPVERLHVHLEPPPRRVPTDVFGSLEAEASWNPTSAKIEHTAPSGDIAAPTESWWRRPWVLVSISLGLGLVLGGGLAAFLFGGTEAPRPVEPAPLGVFSVVQPDGQR